MRLMGRDEGWNRAELARTCRNTRSKKTRELREVLEMLMQYYAGDGMLDMEEQYPWTLIDAGIPAAEMAALARRLNRLAAAMTEAEMIDEIEAARDAASDNAKDEKARTMRILTASASNTNQPS